MHDVREISRWALNSELFAGIPSAEVKEMVSCARTLEFRPGDVINSVDDPITRVLLLIDGRVKRSQVSENGQEVVLRLGVPGEIISEPILSRKGRYCSTVLALRDCKVLAWESASFNAMAERFPGLVRNVQVILNSRLVELTQRFCEVSTKPTSPRLAIVLIDLAARIGERVDEHIELCISQETLGQMTGMTLNSVWRLLSIWKRQGIVKLRRGIVEIHDLRHLLGCTQLSHTSARDTLSTDAVIAPETTRVGFDTTSSQVAGD